MHVVHVCVRMCVWVSVCICRCRYECVCVFVCVGVGVGVIMSREPRIFILSTVMQLTCCHSNNNFICLLETLSII